GLLVFDGFLAGFFGEFVLGVGLGVEAFLALSGFLQEVVEEGAELALSVAQRDEARLVLLVLGQRIGGLGVLVDGELHGLEEAEFGLGGELGAAAAALAAAV